MNISDVHASQINASDVAVSPPSALPGSERPDYRGKCRYKTGKCINERALKTSGAAHNLCDEHRNKQNQHQRKLDAKNRQVKRERRVFAPKGCKSERFVPYPMTSVQAASQVTAISSGEKGKVEPSLPLTLPVVATASSGVMYLPNGLQPPQMSYPFMMQDFDGIVVPLPSYLEGQERIEFRSRIYQRVLDFISKECMLRFGVKTQSMAGDTSASAGVATAVTTQSSIGPDGESDVKTQSVAGETSASAGVATAVAAQSSNSPGDDSGIRGESASCDTIAAAVAAALTAQAKSGTDDDAKVNLKLLNERIEITDAQQASASEGSGTTKKVN